MADANPVRTGFPQASDRLDIHLTADGGTLLTFAEPDGDGRRQLLEQYETERYFLRFLQLADGTRSYSQIQTAFEDEVGALFGSALAAKALDVALGRGLCTLRPEAAASAAGVRRVTGATDAFHPLHATLEIIETCNFTCVHCYYSSSPAKRGRLTLEEAERILDTLAARGVRVVELTGGECTIHPDFTAILRRAASNFMMVCIISNGYLLGTRPGLMDTVASYPNVIAQISIDGLEEHHDQWRRHPGAFRAATTAAKGLAERGVMVRMACTISESNVHQIVPLYRLAKDLGVGAVSFAPVAALGRGCNIADPGAGARELVHAINSALAPYSADPILNSGSRPPSGTLQPHNCGAGHRTYAVDYEGRVRACNFSRDSKAFGNLLTEPYEDLFGQAANFMFRAAPSPGGADCVDCRYVSYCQGCFVKAFMLSESEYPQCPWRQRWFPGMALTRDEPLSPADRKQLPLLLERPSTACTSCGQPA